MSSLRFSAIFVLLHAAHVSLGIPAIGQDNVILTQVYFRHGERTPLVKFPTGEINGTQIWATELMELTELGKAQSHELGTWLRRRYSNLLPAEYRPQDINVLSTDTDRTLGTAMAVLAGLYPPRGNSSLHSQLIPVHSVPQGCDTVLQNMRSCKRINQVIAQVWNSTEMACVLRNHSAYFDFLKNMPGKTNKRRQSVIGEMYHILVLQNAILQFLKTSNKSHHQFDMELMESLDILGFLLFPVITKELQILHSGNLLSETVEHMAQKKNGVLKPDRKMYMYSGHDVTVGPLMHTLGIYDAYPVPYAGALMIDLVLQRGSYYVKIHYRNSTENEPVLLTLPDCESSCPLEKFQRIAQPFKPENWSQACTSVDNPLQRLEYILPKRGNMKGWTDCFKPPRRQT